MTRTQLDERTLVNHVTARRWYGSKGREIVSARIVDSAELPGFRLCLVQLGFHEGTHEIYQLLVGSRVRRLDGARAEAEVPARPAPEREQSELDGLVVQAPALVDLIRAGEPQPAGKGTIEFHHVEGFDLDRELGPARPIGTEQSNSSVVLGEELILKAYRRLEAGVNPELEMLRFLSERGFPNVPRLGGWYAYEGRPLEATLGVVQEYAAGGLDGWELALDELAAAPDRFLRRLRRLGEVTGELHTVLASDHDDPSFCAEEPSLESLGLLTAMIDEEIERAFLELPADEDALAPIIGRGEEIRERLRSLTHVGTTGRSIRHHGDFHLGQTLLGEDWLILDFEGEPARSLLERRRKRSPLRDVAGMLRSFAYAASAVGLLRGATPPPEWEERARAAFLDGYLDAVDPEIVPAGREAFDKLLSVFELQKAVYELRYELNMRPDWVPIPVAGIVRMLES